MLFLSNAALVTSLIEFCVVQNLGAGEELDMFLLSWFLSIATVFDCRQRDQKET